MSLVLVVAALAVGTSCDGTLVEDEVASEHSALELKPGANGAITHWLVAGDYSANDIDQGTIIPEGTVKPSFGEPSGGAFNSGRWTAISSSTSEIALGADFPRASRSGGRIAYAFAYVVNTTRRDLPVQMVMDTPNPVRLYVDGELAAAGDGGGGASAQRTLHARSSTRILVKVFQRSGDTSFKFRARLNFENGSAISDNGEVIIRLSPPGGI